jgi:hypothetical protein
MAPARGWSNGRDYRFLDLLFFFVDVPFFFAELARLLEVALAIV